MSPQTEVNELKEFFDDYLILLKKIEGKEPEHEDFCFGSNEVNNYIKKIGLKLYSHQTHALNKLYKGHNVVVTTPTASGKSEIFRLYILDKIIKNPLKTFLLIFPTRALLYDQYENFSKRIKLFSEVTNTKINIKTSILLGDLSLSEKNKEIRKNPNVIFTTIDNLHIFLLKNHQDAMLFFKNLDLIVVDEIHTYRGIFGTNAAYVFRRLFRLLDLLYKNKNYRILALSATLLNAKEFCTDLFGKKFTEINKDGSKRFPRYIILLDSKGSSKIVLRRVIRAMLELNIKSLVFLESKKSVELQSILVRDLDSLNKIHPYKASFTREKRREIEQKFKKGELQILITTSALELGIDIGDVKAVINYGIPRDGLFSLIQRLGRAGRNSEGYNIIIFKKDALDFYYAKNKEKFVDNLIKNKIEQIPINLYNKEIVKKHLLYLLNEIKKIHENYLTDIEKTCLKELENENKIKKVKDYFFGGNYIVLNIHKINYSGLRAISDKVFVLVNPSSDMLKYIHNLKKEDSAIKILNLLKRTGGILEEVDELAFYEYLLPGMIYYSAGEVYRIEDFKTCGNITFIFPRKTRDYYIETSPISFEDVKIIEIKDSKSFYDWKIYVGNIEVTKKYVGYIEFIKSNNQIVTHYYENPIERKFITNSVWIEIPKEYKDIQEKYRDILNKKVMKIINNLGIDKEIIYNLVYSIDKDLLYEKYRGLTSRRIYEIIRDTLERFNIQDRKLVFYIKKLIDSDYAFRSGLHAIEHNLIKISPVVTNIDSRELGGYSYPFHPQIANPVIFIYEGYENGVGLAEIIYHNIENLIEESINIIKQCKCSDGCPRCILSTKCGNFNEFLDKYAARLIYQKLLRFKRRKMSK